MPVYPHLDADYTALQPGTRIRDQRKKRGWTLEELASRLSLSVGTLSAIENQRIAPKLETFLAIRDVLDVPLETLLPPSTTRHFHIARREPIDGQSTRPIKFVNPANGRLMSYRNRLRLLAQPFVGKHLEPFDLEIHPAANEDLHFISHNHEEFFFVLRGKAECLIKTPDGLTRETLEPGDSMYFWSYLPHCIRALTQEPARSINVVCSLHETADSESTDGNWGPIIYLMDAYHKNLVQQIAAKVVSLRHARGLSAAEFSERLGISVARLTRIEHAESSISLELLLQICRTLRKPREYFLAGTRIERPFSAVLHAPGIRRMRSRSVEAASCFASARVKPLASGFPGRSMQPSLVRVNRESDGRSKMARHRGQEFVYVLDGDVRLITSCDNRQVDETLSPGDSCFIDASVPHRFIEAHFSGYGESGAELLVVQWSPIESQTDAHR